MVIKTLSETGQRLRGVSGGAILGHGRVALIPHVAQVAALAVERAPGGSSAGGQGSSEPGVASAASA